MITIHDDTRPVVCFIPCCGGKFASGQIAAGANPLSQADLPNTYGLLNQGRTGMVNYINDASQPTSSLYLYTGHFYSPLNPNLNNLTNAILAGNFKLIIISASDGLIDGLEPIYKYNAEMKSNIASQWRNFGLVNIISDLLITINPAKVFGYFAGGANWSNAGAKYRYFFTEGLRMAISNGLSPQIGGCFFRDSGMGLVGILRSLGQTFLDHFSHNFSQQFALITQRNYRTYNYGLSSIRIGFI